MFLVIRAGKGSHEFAKGYNGKTSGISFLDQIYSGKLDQEYGGYIDICFFFLVCFPRTIALLALPVFFLDFFQNRNNFC